MKNISCVIFDMDGVIIDSEALHRKAYFKTFASLGVRVSEELYGTMTGSSTINVFQQLVDHFNLDEDPEALVIQKREHYIYDFENDPSIHLVDGVEEIIKYFHQKGLTLILASSSAMQNIDRVFNRFNLNQYFSAKISGADLLRSKPNPEIFEKAAILGNTAKENCVVIEDSENGIRAAKAAGIFVFGYKNALARNQDLKEADLIISTFSDIKEYL